MRRRKRFSISNKGIEQKNAHILALFIFQYSFLIPFMMFFSPSFLVAISSVLLALESVIINFGKKGAMWPLCFLIVVTAIIIAKFLLFHGNIRSIIIFLSIAFPATIVCIFEIDYNEFLFYLSKLSVVNFFVICWYPLVRIDYMRFGYGILLSCMGLYICLFQRKGILKCGHLPILHIIIFFLSTIELVLYGARGAALSFALLVIIDYLVIRRQKKKTILFLFLVIVAMVNFNEILLLLEKIANKVGIGSRAIMKYRLLLAGADTNLILSGRLGYYQAALKKFRNHPIFGGVIDLVNEQYSHNIVLDVMKDLGLVGLSIFILFLVDYFLVMRKKNIDKDLIAILGFLFSLSMGRLLFSSSIWLRPEFWVLIAFYFSRFHSRIRFCIGYRGYDGIANRHDIN